MIAERELDNKNAGKWAWFAAQDARMKSHVNSTTYSDSQKVRAERMKMCLDTVYGSQEIFIEFRKTFISVKINKPRIRDRAGLVMLETDYASEGIVKRTTTQGITYRLPKT